MLFSRYFRIRVAVFLRQYERFSELFHQAHGFGFAWTGIQSCTLLLSIFQHDFFSHQAQQRLTDCLPPVIESESHGATTLQKIGGNFGSSCLRAPCVTSETGEHRAAEGEMCATHSHAWLS